MKIQELICQELNLPFIILPVPSQAGSQPQSSANPTAAETFGIPSKENGSGNEGKADVAPGTADATTQPQSFQEVMSQYRDMQRRQVEFIKKRVLLLEKGLNAECEKDFFVSCSLSF